MKNNIIRHFANVGIGLVINIIIGFISTPLITRIVDPTEYGQLSIFDTYAGIISSFVYCGLDYSLVRFFYDYKDDNEKVGLIKLCTYIPTIFSIIIFIILFILIKIGLISFKFSSFIFILLFTNVIFTLWQKIATSVLRIQNLSKEYSISIVLQKITYTLTIIIFGLIIKKYYLLMLILATIFSYVVSTIYSIFVAKDNWKLNSASPINNKKEVLYYGIPMIAFALIITLLDSLDKLVLDYYCSEYEIGVYTSAFTLIAMMSLIKTVFNSIWIPIQTKNFIDNPEDTTFIKKGNKYITIILFYSSVFLIMFRNIFVYILGSSYRDSAVYMPMLIIECVMYTLSDSTCSGIDKSKKSYLNIVVSGLACVFSLVFQIILIPKLGPMGAAIGRMVASIAYFYLRTYYSNKYYYIDYSLSKFTPSLVILIIFSIMCLVIDNLILIYFSFVVILLYVTFVYFADIKDMIGILLNSYHKN